MIKEAGLYTFDLLLGVTVRDLNQEGWPDLNVSNDFSTPDLFYLNNKNGTFLKKLRTLESDSK